MKKMIIVLIIILTIITILYLALYVFQRKLLYFPTSVDKNTIESIKRKYKNSEVFLKTKDNIKLHSWFIDKNSDTTIIYFGGNAEDVNYTVLNFLDNFNCNIATFSYRSYGLSEGSISQENIFKDVLFFYDYLLSAKKVKKIILIGRSLGSGIAVYLASKRDVEKIVLISPYDSILNIAKEQFYFAPVSLILKDQFNAQKYAKNIKNKPLLAIYSTSDKVVTMKHSKSLIKVWNGDVKLLEKNYLSHNDLLFDIGLIKKIREFIKNK